VLGADPCYVIDFRYGQSSGESQGGSAQFDFTLNVNDVTLAHADSSRDPAGMAECELPQIDHRNTVHLSDAAAASIDPLTTRSSTRHLLSGLDCQSLCIPRRSRYLLGEFWCYLNALTYRRMSCCREHPADGISRHSIQLSLANQPVSSDFNESFVRNSRARAKPRAVPKTQSGIG